MNFEIEKYKQRKQIISALVLQGFETKTIIIGNHIGV